MAINKYINAILKEENRFSFLLLAAAFTLPLGWQAVTNSILMVLLFHSLIFLRGKDWLLALKSPLFWFSGIYFSITFFSLFWVDNTDEGLLQLETKLSFFFGPLLFIAAINKYWSNFRNHFLNAFFYGTIGVGILAIGIAVYKTMQAGQPYFVTPDGLTKISFFTYVEFASPFMHPGYLATYVGVGILIGLYFSFKKQLNSKLPYYLGIGFLFVILIMLQGRINIIALFMVFGIAALYATIKFKKYKLLLLPFIPLVLLLGFLLFGSENIKQRYFQLPDFNYDITGDEFNSATYRLAEWTCAMDVIEENFWLGTGIGDNSQALYDAYENRGFIKGVTMNYNAHNQYIETMISNGVVGLFSLLIFLFVYMRTASANKDYLLLACLVFFAISMLTESMFQRAWAVLLFNMFFPVLLALDTKSKE